MWCPLIWSHRPAELTDYGKHPALLMSETTATLFGLHRFEGGQGSVGLIPVVTCVAGEPVGGRLRDGVSVARHNG